MRLDPGSAPRARSRTSRVWFVGCALGLWTSCQPSGDPGTRAEGGSVVAAPRQRDPALAEVRSALERGHGELALRLLERVPGLEAECLRARAELQHGDAVAALAAIERGRVLAPDDAELAGTEVEILASLDRVQAAAERLALGLARFGAVPVLLRAQGLLELRSQGRALHALAALERARARDPELPFLHWPLAQAHLLAGRALLHSSPAEATAHAWAAREIWPHKDPLYDEARELEAEGLAGELRFEEALAVYVELEERGRTRGVDHTTTRATLHQRCATRFLLERARPRALEHYLAARKLGMNDEGLGFGAEVLAEECRLALERGRGAAEGEDWGAAEREFAYALSLAPGDLEAENHLAVARFQRSDFRGAAEAWEGVLARAQGSASELPDPVALNLAKAWRMAGDPERAREVLSRLLDLEPEGRFSAEARQLLLVLEAETLAGQ